MDLHVGRVAHLILTVAATFEYGWIRLKYIFKQLQITFEFLLHNNCKAHKKLKRF